MKEAPWDCVVVGAGVIGLSVAWELVQAGKSVRVIDRRTTPHIASWAAGGILPPPIVRAVHDPMEQLRDLSHRLYPDWLRRLSDNQPRKLGYERCGGIYLARSIGERVSLQAALEQWKQDGVAVESWSASELKRREPHLAAQPDASVAYYLSDEVRVRPPRILAALAEKLLAAGVSIQHSAQCHWLDAASFPLALHTDQGRVLGRHVCLAAGPWTPSLLTPLGIDLPVEPRRGQMVLWKAAEPLLRHVVNEGPRYLIARDDGHLLAGSTVEEVGYDGTTTPEGVQELTEFAEGLVPCLKDLPPVQAWAGLRPWSIDGMPYLGRAPGHAKVTVATGHFRSGIHLAPATGLLVKQLICDEPLALSLQPFSLQR